MLCLSHRSGACQVPPAILHRLHRPGISMFQSRPIPCMPGTQRGVSTHLSHHPLGVGLLLLDIWVAVSGKEPLSVATVPLEPRPALSGTARWPTRSRKKPAGLPK